MRKRSFPLDPATGKEVRNLEQPGYYPGFSTLAQQRAWDQTTRDLVVKRAESSPAIRFFNAEQAELMAAMIDRILPQDDRAAEKTIPILPFVDERLYKNELNGFRYEDMPPDREAYRLGLKAIAEMAQERFGVPFVSLPVYRQELLLKSLHDGKPEPKHPVWQQMPVHRFWALLLEDCVTAYYSHPWAWDEIGFGGPAYPRGYMRLENGQPEPWETDESRYEWCAPADSVSVIDKEGAPPEHGSTHGHGGTH
jgi:hypothetical protein